jgi:CRISPR/Cas system Type II protein with McrA/HNH and RuvC-like nuclease domain
LSALKNQLDTGEIIFEYQNKIREKNTEKKLEKLKEKEIKLFSPIKDQDMQKNSVVFRAINQVRLVVRDLLKIHNFDGLIIEVAKDLYAEKTLRNKIRSNQDKNQKIRKEAENKLKEHNLIPTSKNINKYLI